MNIITLPTRASGVSEVQRVHFKHHQFSHGMNTCIFITIIIIIIIIIIYVMAQ